MKHAALLILSCILFSPLHAQTKLTIPSLIGKNLERHEKRIESWPGFTISLQKDGSLKVTDMSYGFGENLTEFNGDYTIVSDTEIILKYVLYSGYDAQDIKDFKPARLTSKGKLKINPDAVDNFVTIEFDFDFILACSSIKHPAGLSKKVNSIKVITMGSPAGTISDNAKIRKSPSITAETISYATDLGDEGTPYIAKGKTVTVLARTEKKEQVSKWNNYWYYVELTGAYFSPRYGWIFAEFVSTK